MNTIGRYISNDLEDGDKTIERIVKPLKKTVCAACVNNPNADGKSCCELIARALINFTKPDTKTPDKKANIAFLKNTFLYTLNILCIMKKHKNQPLVETLDKIEKTSASKPKEQACYVTLKGKCLFCVGGQKKSSYAK